MSCKRSTFIKACSLSLVIHKKHLVCLPTLSVAKQGSSFNVKTTVLGREHPQEFKKVTTYLYNEKVCHHNNKVSHSIITQSGRT